MAANEQLVPIRLAPGVYKQGTKYEAKGRWFDANGVRWYDGAMGPIGGWRNITDVNNANLQAVGAPRYAIGFKDNSNISYMAVGTVEVVAGTLEPAHLYQYTDGALNDITPAVSTGYGDGAYASGNYGAGNYGAGNYGTGGGALSYAPADTWSIDNFGQYVVACMTRDGKIWVQTTVNSVPSQAPGSPTGCVGVVVTPEKFLVALGAGGDRRTVAWCSQGSTGQSPGTSADWTASAANTAGSFPLQIKGGILTARRTHINTLIWTDVELIVMTYVGGQAIYGFSTIGEDCGAISPGAVCSAGENMFWMGQGRFFVYDGMVRPIPCDVLDYVFANLLMVQRAKVQCIPNSRFNEVTWFYPSSMQTGTENDSYVTYNYVENHWAIGKLGRGAGIDRGLFEQPIWIDGTGFLYEHEIGSMRAGSGFTPYAESGPLEYGDPNPMGYAPGSTILRVQRYLPDEATLGDGTGAGGLGNTKVTFYAAMEPTDTEQVIGPITPTKTTSLRFTGRQFRMRIDELTQGLWRFGVGRLGVVEGGYR